MTMDNAWTPSWLQVCGVIAYALILAVHLWHAWHLRSPDRLWHLGHVLMSLGMVDMFWPGHMPVGERVGETVFAVAAVTAAGLLAVTGARGHGWRIWLTAVVDMCGMSYMFAMTSHRVVLLTALFVLWTAAEAVLWATGSAFQVLRLRPSGAERASSEQPDSTMPGSRSRHDCGSGWDLRLSLAVMSLGMSYMFLAMQ